MNLDSRLRGNDKWGEASGLLDVSAESNKAGQGFNLLLLDLVLLVIAISGFYEDEGLALKLGILV
ncbi:MAG: hypothetical protein ABFD91_14595 [Anaerohalosphaeraceae bacterium]